MRAAPASSVSVEYYKLRELTVKRQAGVVWGGLGQSWLRFNLRRGRPGFDSDGEDDAERPG